MKCRSCGLEIADKAIVCYRCGTPTADAPAPASTRRRRTNWVAVPIMLLIVALGAWLIPKTTPGSLPRIGAWAVTWLVVFAVAAWLRGRRS
jgi:polyferredoxin